MLFMVIFKWEPDKRNEVLKRRMEQGSLSPPEIKIIGEWVALQGGQSFRLVQTDDPGALMRATMAWGDLGKVEIIPLIETDELMKLAVSGK